MGTKELIGENLRPITKEILIHDLLNLGIKKGDYLIVHTSLKKIGFVIGKEQTLVEALIEVVGEEGLIVMPSQSIDNSNPENWENPPVPESWYQIIKEQTPAYDKDLTVTSRMGVVPEYFRKLKGVIRSDHPQLSFSAYGKRNKELLAKHPFNYGLSDDSPLGLMYKWNFKILLLGTDYNSCTAMHLAEYRANCREKTYEECAVKINNERQWITIEDIDIDSDCFPEIGRLYEQTHTIKMGKIGYSDSRLIDLKSLIDFTTNYGSLSSSVGK